MKKRTQTIVWFGVNVDLEYYCHMVDDGVGANPIFRLRVNEKLQILLSNEQPLSAADLNLPPQGDCGSPISTETSTNLHFHGADVSPICHRDEVVKTIVNAGETWLFNYSFPVTQPAGLLWWHPHSYPNSLYQIAGGATGVFVIDGIDAVQEKVRGIPELILVFRSEPSRVSSFGDPPSEDISLNFIPILYNNNSYTPLTYRIKPDEM